MRKTLLLILTLIMATVPTFAANKDSASFKIDITNDKTGHTYEAYQIISADIDTVDNETVLTNISYGDGITLTDGKYDGKTAEELAKTLTSSETAYAFAKAVTLGAAAGESTFANSKYTISGLKPGYYLIKDKDGTLEGKNDAATAFILRVVGDTTAAPKSDIPTITKKVEDVNDSNGEETDGTLSANWQDSADYDIGDDIPFKLTATLPSDTEVDGVKAFSAYPNYKLVFVDSHEGGLASPSSNIADYDIYFGTTKLTEAQKTTIGASVDVSDAGFELTLNNIKALSTPKAEAGGTVSVIYKAKLDTDAVIGKVGQYNEVYLKYSNNPNGDGMGQTEKDRVRVFTFSVNVSKVDESGNPVTGAKFKLEKKIGNDFQVISADIPLKSGSSNVFEFKGIDDGVYKITETTVPKGYNGAAPIEFTVTASHETDSADPQLTTLNVTGLNGDADSGIISGNVVNKKGLTLPNTGDVGTIAFYVFGLSLIALFVMRKLRSER